MIPNDEAGFERELRAAMAHDVAGLAAPNMDLGAIRRRTAVRRRMLVPAVVGLVSLVIAGPFALAKSDVSLPKLTGAVVPAETPDAPAVPAPARRPDAGEAGTPATEPAGRDVQDGGDAPATACVTGRGPLPAVERAALLRDATAVLRTAQGTVDRALGSVERLRFATGTVDRLLPSAGTVVRLVTCGDQVTLAPVERAAILDRVRTVVRVVAVVAAGVVNETVGQTEAGVATPVLFTVVKVTPKAVLVDLELGGGVLPPLGTVMVSVRLTDGKVVQVDMSGLDLAPLGASGLGALPGLDLLRSLSLTDGLRSLDGLPRVGELVPSAAGVLADDVSIVPPVEL